MKSRLVALKHKNKTAWIYPEHGLQLYGYEEKLKNQLAQVIAFPRDCTEPSDRRYGNPILFPSPSKTHTQHGQDLWEHNGKLFSMPFHGFPRNVYWKILNLEENKIEAEMTRNSSAIISFPFEYKFRASYTLDDRGLVIDTFVENLGQEAFPYGIGFHPYLKAPIGPKGSPADCTIKVPTCTRIRSMDEWKTTETSPFPAHEFRASDNLVDSYLLLESGLRAMEMHDQANKLVTTVSVKESKTDFPVWVVWNASSEAGYVCMEPWSDYPSMLGRAGTHKCPVGKRETSQMIISVREM